MKEKKRREPAAEKRTSSLRKADAKRFLNSKGIDKECQEAKMVVEFLKDYPSTKTTYASLEMLWAFLTLLQSKGFYLVDGSDVYCAPFSHLVNCKNLK